MTDSMESEWDFSRARRVGDLVTQARREAGMTQGQVAEAMGFSEDNRRWVTEVERGRRYKGNTPAILSPSQYVRLAAVVGADPVELLTAARIPAEEWPDLSNVRSSSAIVSRVDTTGLSARQIRLVEELVRELRKVPTDNDDDEDNN